jgi:hypothetical protein
MQQWTMWDSNKCPCCGLPDETMQHVPLCPDPQIIEVWEEQLVALKAWFENANTHPSLSTCIISELQTCNLTTQFQDYALAEAYNAAMDQDWLAQFIGGLGLIKMEGHTRGILPWHWLSMHHKCLGMSIGH